MKWGIKISEPGKPVGRPRAPYDFDPPYPPPRRVLEPSSSSLGVASSWVDHPPARRRRVLEIERPRVSSSASSCASWNAGDGLREFFRRNEEFCAFAIKADFLRFERVLAVLVYLVIFLKIAS